MTRTVREFDIAVIAERDGRTVVSVRGEIDAYTAPRVREQLTQLVNQGRTKILVDLRETDFIDSSGLGALVVSSKELRRQGGELALRAPTARVYRVLEISGLTRVFTVEDPPAAGSAAGDD